MNHHTYIHCGGDKALAVVRRKEIAESIGAVTVKPAPGAASKIRDALLAALKIRGWSEEVAVALGSDMTITSMKGDVGLCLQTGNMARAYADLMKLQTLYLNNAIKSAAIIVPCYETARLLGSNIAQSKRLERELEIFKKAYHVPTVIFALET
ncbi:hypothetical protein D9M68_166000 [compost metagenome]